jgi:hypothetical protein
MERLQATLMVVMLEQRHHREPTLRQLFIISFSTPASPYLLPPMVALPHCQG